MRIRTRNGHQIMTNNVRLFGAPKINKEFKGSSKTPKNLKN